MAPEERVGWLRRASPKLQWAKLMILVGLGTVIISYFARVAALMPIRDQSEGLVIAKSVIPMIGVTMAASIAISVWLVAVEHGRVLKRPAVHKLLVWSMAVCMVSTALGIGIALVPKERDAVENSLIVPPVPSYPQGPIVVQHPIFFANGARTLDAGQRRVLADFFAAAASCTDLQLEVFGFASSATYANDPLGEKNLKLALDRADSIIALARDYQITDRRRHEWSDITEMNRKRGVKDEVGGARVTVREFLNRRADVVIHLPAECADTEVKEPFIE
jgi:hypothetical protein